MYPSCNAETKDHSIFHMYLYLGWGIGQCLHTCSPMYLLYHRFSRGKWSRHWVSFHPNPFCGPTHSAGAQTAAVTHQADKSLWQKGEAVWAGKRSSLLKTDSLLKPKYCVMKSCMQRGKWIHFCCCFTICFLKRAVDSVSFYLLSVTRGKS